MSENHALCRNFLVLTLGFPESKNIFYRSAKNDAQYTVPGSIKVFGRMWVCLQSGAALTDQVIAPVTNFPEAVFEHISTSLNGVNISDHGISLFFIEKL